MERILEKNIDIETSEDVEGIKKGLDDAKNGRVFSVDIAMKKLFNETEAWKSLV